MTTVKDVMGEQFEPGPRVFKPEEPQPPESSKSNGRKTVTEFIRNFPVTRYIFSDPRNWILVYVVGAIIVLAAVNISPVLGGRMLDYVFIPLIALHLTYKSVSVVRYSM
jgi:hypothetical protein